MLVKGIPADTGKPMLTTMIFMIIIKVFLFCDIYHRVSVYNGVPWIAVIN